jgi:hypothetical protein
MAKAERYILVPANVLEEAAVNTAMPPREAARHGKCGETMSEIEEARCRAATVVCQMYFETPQPVGLMAMFLGAIRTNPDTDYELAPEAQLIYYQWASPENGVCESGQKILYERTIDALLAAAPSRPTSFQIANGCCGSTYCPKRLYHMALLRAIRNRIGDK